MEGVEGGGGGGAGAVRGVLSCGVRFVTRLLAVAKVHKARTPCP